MMIGPVACYGFMSAFVGFTQSYSSTWLVMENLELGSWDSKIVIIIIQVLCVYNIVVSFTEKVTNWLHITTIALCYIYQYIVHTIIWYEITHKNQMRSEREAV